MDASPTDAPRFWVRGDPKRVAELLEVTDRTVRRWAADPAGMPAPVKLALRLLDGEIPCIHSVWAGWEIDRKSGALLTPTGEAYWPGDILAIRLERQRLAALRRELENLRASAAADPALCSGGTGQVLLGLLGPEGASSGLRSTWPSAFAPGKAGIAADADGEHSAERNATTTKEG